MIWRARSRRAHFPVFNIANELAFTVVLIGILSDTHDRVDAAAAGLAVLQQQKAEFFIHCGDVGSERVLDHLAGLRAAFVFGNNDYDHRGLERYADQIGIQCLGLHGELVLDGKLIAVHHGDDFAFNRRLIAEQRHDYLLQGHTHHPADQRAGKIHLINPGALYRARTKTVAVLDTTIDLVKFLEVKV